jgi:hypothetical protein
MPGRPRSQYDGVRCEEPRNLYVIGFFGERIRKGVKIADIQLTDWSPIGIVLVGDKAIVIDGRLDQRVDLARIQDSRAGFSPIPSCEARKLKNVTRSEEGPELAPSAEAVASPVRIVWKTNGGNAKL